MIMMIVDGYMIDDDDGDWRLPNVMTIRWECDDY